VSNFLESTKPGLGPEFRLASNNFTCCRLKCYSRITAEHDADSIDGVESGPDIFQKEDPERIEDGD
jgi:hypothetical protein